MQQMTGYLGLHKVLMEIKPIKVVVHSQAVKKAFMDVPWGVSGDVVDCKRASFGLMDPCNNTSILDVTFVTCFPQAAIICCGTLWRNTFKGMTGL